MKSKINVLANVGWQVLFWAIILYFFVNYSFLRPSSGSQSYEEYICLTMIISMVYLNYLILIPQYFQKGRLVLYWIATILSIIMVVLGEYLLFKPIMHNCYPKEFSEEKLNLYLKITFFLCLLRTICFFLFFFVVKLYQDLSSRYIAESHAMANSAHTMAVMKSDKEIEIVNTSDIVYMSHNKNYTYFHMSTGEKYFQYIPLKAVGNLLPTNTFLRISKSHIIMLLKVVDYDDSFVAMNLVENKKQVRLLISSKYKDDVLPILKKCKANILTDNDSKVKKNKGGAIKNKNGTINIENKSELAQENSSKKADFDSKLLETEIFNYISEHSNCKLYEIEEAINKPRRTIQRCIKTMKDEGVVEYIGAKKTGGYFITMKKKKNKKEKNS